MPPGMICYYLSMARKKRFPIQIDEATKEALDKHKSATSSKSYGEAVANLLGVKATKGTHKKHTGVPSTIIDVAILRTWEMEVRYFETTKDKTRAEIITTVKEALEKPYPTGKTWASLYPRWFRNGLEEYVDNQLKSLKRRGFINNSKKGAWTMGSTALVEDDWDLLRLVTERIHPHKELKLSAVQRQTAFSVLCSTY